MRTQVALFLLSVVMVSAGVEAQVRAPMLRRGGSTGGAAAPGAATAENATSATEIAQQLAKAERGGNGRVKLKFDNAPAEFFLQIYSQVTHRTLLTSPDVPKVTMSLRSTDEENWTEAEYLQAIEQQLQLNGIGLIPVGERFALVVPFKTIGQQGIETFLEVPPSGRHPEEGRIIRQIITPKHVSAEEAQKAIESFKRPDGQIQYLERTNSLLVTDTQENVNRMLEIINFIDKPMPVLEEVQVYAIKHAKAEDIKKALEEFVQASREEDEKSRKTTAAPRTSNSLGGGMQRGISISATRQLPGVTRPTAQAEAAQASTVSDALVSDADRGMIRGKVQIMSDERSNQLIIVTRPSNMAFFERIIKVLDVETAPEISVEIIRLRYAQAETKDSNKGVADLLNELIDASSTSRSTNAQNNNNARNAQTNNRNLTNARQQMRSTASMLSSNTKSKLGELRKENIKILADSRINAVMVMASPGDLAAIKEIIAEMDVPVSQVLIETVVLNVALGDDITTGIQWVKRVAGGNKYKDSYGGGGMPSDAGVSPNNLFNLATNVTSALGAISGGSQYYGTINKLNLDFLIRATETDTRSKVITSPILMTQDNKEATLEATELAYLYNGMKYMGSSYNGSDYQPDIKQEEVGLTVKVTPRINPDGTVVLTFEETFQQNTKTQNVPGSGADGASADWPIITTRKISGDISVTNGQTVVIGGLVQQTKKESEGGIPVLKNIPWIGRYLFGYTSFEDERDELLIFLTPYVFTSSEEAQAEAKRRKDYLDAAGVWNKGWSNSSLADQTDDVEMLRREEQKRAYELKQFKAHEKRLEAERAHDKKMIELLEKSIQKKESVLREERDSLTEKDRKRRERELTDERLMHRALLRELTQEMEFGATASEPGTGSKKEEIK